MVADNSKFDSYSFYSFYRVEDLNAIITDDSIPKKIKDKYALYTENHLRSRGWDKVLASSIISWFVEQDAVVEWALLR